MLNNTNKAQMQRRGRQIVAAFTQHYRASDVVTLNGTPYKVRELQKMLADHATAQDAADALASKWRTAVAAAQAKAVEVAGILPALRTAIVNANGAESQIVADFGFTPKTRATTPEAQAAGVAKRAATRQRRGTMGKRQRAKLEKAQALASLASPPNPNAGTTEANGASAPDASAPKTPSAP